MFSKQLATGAFAIACVAAATVGGYLATQQASVGTEAAAATNTGAISSAPAGTPASAPTDEVVAPAPPAVAATPATASRLGPRRDAGRVRPASARTPASAPSALPSTSEAQAGVHVAGRSDAAPDPVDTPTAPTLADNHQVPESAAAPETLPATPVDPANGVHPLGQVSFDELVVSADSVVGLELDRGVSSERAHVEDEVDARVVRDVRVARQVAIPAGARAIGSVMVVERGGKFKERARLGIRFHTLVLGDGSRLPIQTDTIYRYGAERGDSSARKIGGGAVAGAILGAIIGGAKGAAVGATAGAGGGTAMVMAGERSAAEFQSGAEVTARILSPVTVTIER